MPKAIIVLLLTILNGDSLQVWEFVSSWELVINCCSASLTLYCLSATLLVTDTLCLGTLFNELLSKGSSVPALWEFSILHKSLSLWEDVVIYLFTQNACLSLLSISQTNIVGMCTIIENSDWRGKVMNWPEGMSWKLGAIYMFLGVCTDHLQNI